MELVNTLAAYYFDKKQADFALDQTLAGLDATKDMDEIQMGMAVDEIQASIDRGVINLATMLADIDAEEQAGLLAYQNSVAKQVALIAKGETTLEATIANGLINYRAAVGAGLITYENAIEMGADQYEINIGNFYDDMIFQMDNVMEEWADENADTLADILATGTKVTAPTAPESRGIIFLGINEYGEPYYGDPTDPDTPYTTEAPEGTEEGIDTG